MPTIWKRRGAGVCLILAPFIYYLGLFYKDQFPILSRFLILEWMLISLIVGILAALTFRWQIFGPNCGSFLGYSPGIMMIAMTLQISELKSGEWLMYAFFLISFIAGCVTLWKNISGNTAKLNFVV